MAFKLKDRGGTNNWINHVLEIFALFMLTGVFSTLLIPETKQLSLEVLSNENQEHFVKVSPDTPVFAIKDGAGPEIVPVGQVQQSETEA